MFIRRQTTQTFYVYIMSVANYETLFKNDSTKLKKKNPRSLFK